MRLGNHTGIILILLIIDQKKKKCNAIYLDLALKTKKRDYRLGKPSNFPI